MNNNLNCSWNNNMMNNNMFNNIMNNNCMNNNMIMGNNMMNNSMNIFNSNNNLMSSINSLSTNMSSMSLETNSEIKLKFTFVNAQSFLVKCEKNEKLSEVINRFKQTQCPKKLKDLLDIPLYGGQKVDKDKTISELGIKDNQIILFISTKKIEEDSNEEEKKEEYHLDDDEKLQLKKWLDEYEGMKLLKKINKILNNKEENNNNDNNNPLLLDSRESVSNFLEFVKQKEGMGAIKIKEHSHKLAYCISILNWSCSLCNKKFSKDNARYYCSICDYNMCEKCHSKGNYTKKKVFSDDVKPSNPDVKNPFLTSKHHEHKLIYCRSSRSVIGYNSWICDICRLDFDNNIWSFYCTECDFDLCCKCAGFN